MSNSNGFQCSGCNSWHSHIPLAFHAHAPAAWDPDRHAEEGFYLDGELCVIANSQGFVRSVVQTPVLGRPEIFEWGVWVALSP